jgi:hypothetical protein
MWALWGWMRCLNAFWMALTEKIMDFKRAECQNWFSQC